MMTMNIIPKIIKAIFLVNLSVKLVLSMQLYESDMKQRSSLERGGHEPPEFKFC